MTMTLHQAIRVLRIPLLVQGLIFVTVTTDAQNIRSYYRLKNVALELTNGRVIQSELLGFSEDSMVVVDRSKIPPGSLVSVHLPHNSNEIRCLVKEFTESHAVLANPDGTGEWRIARNQLHDLKVEKFSLDDDKLDRFQVTAYPFSQVESLALHRKGSGLLLGVLGFVVGGAIGGAIHQDPPPSSQPTSLSAAFKISFEGAAEISMAGVIGMSFGILVGTHNKKHYIHGNHEAFLRLRSKVVRMK